MKVKTRSMRPGGFSPPHFPFSIMTQRAGPPPMNPVPLKWKHPVPLPPIAQGQPGLARSMRPESLSLGTPWKPPSLQWEEGCPWVRENERTENRQWYKFNPGKGMLHPKWLWSYLCQNIEIFWIKRPVKQWFSVETTEIRWTHDLLPKDQVKSKSPVGDLKRKKTSVTPWQKASITIWLYFPNVTFKI